MRLIVNQRGTVLSAAGSTPKSMFGFDPATDLVGRPLAAFITQFEEFRVKHSVSGQSNGSAPAAAPVAAQGQDYSQLALQLREDMPAAGDSDFLLTESANGAYNDDSMLLLLLAQAWQEGNDATYRVGVRAAPLEDEQIGKSCSTEDAEHGAHAGQLSNVLLAVMGGRGGTKLRPAVMQLSVVQPDWTGDNAASLSISGSVEFEVCAGVWCGQRLA